MKKYLIILLIIVSLSAYGFDFGIVIENTSTVSTDENAPFFQKDKISLWFDLFLKEHTELFMQGSYTYAIDKPYLFNLDYFYFEAVIPHPVYLFTFDAGRLDFSDFTGYVLNHTLDGFFFKFDWEKVHFSFFTAFSGGLLKDTYSILISNADQSDQNREDMYYGPLRIFEGFELTFPDAFARQVLTLSFLAQQDVRHSDNFVSEGEENEFVGRGGRLHTIYTGIGLGGGFSSKVFYDLFFFMGTGNMLSYLSDSGSGTGNSYQIKWMLSFLGGANLRIYSEKARYSLIEINFVFSSGDSDYSSFLEGNTEGLPMQFIAMSESSLSRIFKPQLGNLFFFDFAYSFKPFSRIGYRSLNEFQLEFNTAVFFRQTATPISVSGLDDTSDSRYLGTEMGITLNFRPLSDLGASLAFALFLPNNYKRGSLNGAFDDDDRKIEFITQLYISFSL